MKLLKIQKVSWKGFTAKQAHCEEERHVFFLNGTFCWSEKAPPDKHVADRVAQIILEE